MVRKEPPTFGLFARILLVNKLLQFLNPDVYTILFVSGEVETVHLNCFPKFLQLAINPILAWITR